MIDVIVDFKGLIIILVILIINYSYASKSIFNTTPPSKLHTQVEVRMKLIP